MGSLLIIVLAIILIFTLPLRREIRQNITMRMNPMKMKSLMINPMKMKSLMINPLKMKSKYLHLVIRHQSLLIVWGI